MKNKINKSLKLEPHKRKEISPAIYAYATEAHHKLGDISRKPSEEIEDLADNVCTIYAEDEFNWIGSWITGFGFFDVKFPKNTTRALTKEEMDAFSKMHFAINNQPTYNFPDVQTIPENQKSK